MITHDVASAVAAGQRAVVAKKEAQELVVAARRVTTSEMHEVQTSRQVKLEEVRASLDAQLHDTLGR